MLRSLREPPRLDVEVPRIRSVGDPDRRYAPVAQLIGVTNHAECPSSPGGRAIVEQFDLVAEGHLACDVLVVGRHGANPLRSSMQSASQDC